MRTILLKEKMMPQRDINKIQTLIFLQRLIVYFIVLRYFINKKPDETIIASYVFPAQPEGLDAVGNIKKVIQTEPLTPLFTEETTGYSYNLKKNRLDLAGSNTFTYDNEGQLATGYGSTYTFDYEHKLTAISGAFNAQYFYDGKGHRLKAIRSGVTTKSVYDINGNVIAEADSSNNITRYYVHGLGLMSFITPADSVYSYHFNNIGSTIAITDASQAIVNKYSYDPFGVLLNEQETIAQPFKYVGQHGVMHEPNGFYYMRARYYDPKVGRFVSEDPIGFEGRDTNLMRYVSNSPVNRIDSLGLAADCNGCGPDDWRSKFVPNRPFFIVDFTSACNSHDRCYAKCGAKKADCDTNFKGDMGLLCYRKYGSKEVDPIVWTDLGLI